MHKGCGARIFAFPTVAFLSLMLAACGGGGGGSTNAGGILPTPQTSTTPGNSTTAKGTLVDDPSGTPLAGVKVAVQPWITYPTPGPTPTPIAVSTTAADGSFTISEPNGTYMLVIGSDSTTDTTRPTIHDKIVLSGQTTLTAPTPAPFPLVTPDAIETSGKYRLATIDPALELPCITAFQNHRESLNLSKAVVDQWLTENARSDFAMVSNIAYVSGMSDPWNPYGPLTTAHVTIQGGTSCADLNNATWSLGASYSTLPGVAWYAGLFSEYESGNQSFGQAQYPEDPRIERDLSALPWY